MCHVSYFDWEMKFLSLNVSYLFGQRNPFTEVLRASLSSSLSLYSVKFVNARCKSKEETEIKEKTLSLSYSS